MKLLRWLRIKFLLCLYPYGDIYEGTSTIQCCCPTCDYGRGRLDNFIEPAPVLRVVLCDKCQTKYVALTL